MNKLTAEVTNLLKSVENLQVDTNKLPNELKNFMQSLDLKTLQNLKNSIDYID